VVSAPTKGTAGAAAAAPGAAPAAAAGAAPGVAPGPTAGTVRGHLALMHAQREALFDAIADVPQARLWARPNPKKWSAGEHLDHTRVLNRAFRRLFAAAWPALSPWARRRADLPYATDIDDVYERPNMPLWVGFLWPPRRTPERPTSLDELRRALTDEHEAVARFYADKPEPVLGHAALWDPAIGRINLIQGLRVGVHHDLHHYRIARRMLGR